MDFSNFYTVGEAWMRGAMRFDLQLDKIAAPDLFHGLHPEARIDVNKQEGTRVNDIAGTGFAFIRLASSGFWQLVEDHHLKGIRPVTAVLKKNEIGFTHSICTVTGKCGPRLHELSVEMEVPEVFDPEKRRRTWMGLYFAIETWDGSDFFSIEGTHFTVVTQRVVDIMTRNKISNIQFTPISDVENHDLLLKSQEIPWNPRFKKL